MNSAVSSGFVAQLHRYSLIPTFHLTPTGRACTWYDKALRRLIPVTPCLYTANPHISSPPGVPVRAIVRLHVVIIAPEIFLLFLAILVLAAGQKTCGHYAHMCVSVLVLVRMILLGVSACAVPYPCVCARVCVCLCLCLRLHLCFWHWWTCVC